MKSYDPPSMARHRRVGFLVIYTEKGVAKHSEIFDRFDSLNESSAKTFALEVLGRGCTCAYICEVLPTTQVILTHKLRELV